jgi:hypothetical protein
VPVSRVYREFDALQADDRSAFGHEGGPRSWSWRFRRPFLGVASTRDRSEFTSGSGSTEASVSKTVISTLMAKARLWAGRTGSGAITSRQAVARFVLTWDFAAKINKLRRHAEVLSK